MIILDTNVLSELMRPQPSERVLIWFAQHSAMQLFVTTVTEAEIYYGLGCSRWALGGQHSRKLPGECLMKILLEDGYPSTLPPREPMLKLRRYDGKRVAQFIPAMPKLPPLPDLAGPPWQLAMSRISRTAGLS